jgi:hypothetical protein
MQRHPFLVSAFALLAAWLVGVAPGQCPTSWSSGAVPSGLSGPGSCTAVWDPDGGGPLPQRLVVGGQDLVGGSAVSAQKVMTWDGTQWLPLADGPGTSGGVNKATTWNGLLVVSGSFLGGGTDRIAMWNGTAWQALAGGLSFAPTALAVFGGNLIACGNLATPVVAVWNGSSWSNLPTPPGMTDVRAAASFQGHLWIGGANGSNGVLNRWSGSAWLASTAASGPVNCLGVRASTATSNLYAGGAFNNVAGTSTGRVATTAGGTSPVWAPVGSYNGTEITQMHVRTIGAVGVAVVIVTPGGLGGPAQTLQLSGSTFAPMGTSPVFGVSYYGGAYHGVASGAGQCRRYDGVDWQLVLGQGIDGEVRALTPSGSDMIVGGTFVSSAGASSSRVAKWNGTTLSALGSGITGTSVDALLTLGNGDIIVGGQFLAAAGVSVNNVARWDGANWSSVGTGFNQQVLALARMPNGDIVAGGRFTMAGLVSCSRIARWNGTSWAPLGLGMNGDVHALAVRSDGRLFAGGSFTIAGTAACSRIAQWNGTTWSPLGFGVNDDVYALAVRPNDDIVAAGAFTAVVALFAERCARWTGSAWATMGGNSADPSPVRSLFAMPNGDVIAGRGFHQAAANPDAGISRWNGFSWTGFGAGLASQPAGASVAVRALANRADGALVVGGAFGVADGVVANGLARLTSTCPAMVVPFGAGCSAAGPLVQTATTLPWLGSTFRTTTTGLQPASACVVVVGFSPTSIPLSSLLPEGQPGCTLLVTLDILGAVTADATGTALSALALGNSPALLGGVFHQQTIPVELNGFGVVTAVRAANALSATIGKF